MNESEVALLIRKIKIRWPSFRLDEDLDLMMEVYLDDLAEFEAVAVDKAYRSLKDQTFAPTLSEIRGVLSPPDLGEEWMVRRKTDPSFMHPDS